MIRRLYVENYRCLGQFNLELSETPNALLVGRNGAGKSSLRDALIALRQISVGRASFEQSLPIGDLSWFTTEKNMTFLIEASVSGKRFLYELQLDLPEGFRQFRVVNEYLVAGQITVFSRHLAEVSLTRDNGKQTAFPIDWHQTALPVIQEATSSTDLARFRSWLSNLLIIAPLPPLIEGESKREAQELDKYCLNFAEWYRALTVEYPSVGASVQVTLREIWPELHRMANRQVSLEGRSLEFEFKDSTVAAPQV